jgi:hypothetical protein
MGRPHFVALVLLGAGLALSTGCDSGPSKPAGKVNQAEAVAAEREKLSPEDRALVEAQEWCAVQTDERLGSMGAPIKLEIQGQPVFLCCKGCQRKAEQNPDATVAKVEELKARVRTEKGTGK